MSRGKEDRGPREARENRHVRDKVIRSRYSEDDLPQLLGGKKAPLVLILDCVQDPNNLGAILRTCDGAGVDVVIAPKDKSAGITETVRRVSVGAADLVPFVQVTNLSRTITYLQKELGVWLSGTSDQATQSLYDLDFTGPTAIVMGAEGTGMRRLTEEKCDHLIKIPMAGRIDCLNVSVATGVCLYEVARQRGVLSGA